MKPTEFLEQAKRLAANGARAADFRTAVSRAYYAAYHVAFAELVNLGCAPTTDNRGHIDIRDHLSNSGDQLMSEFAIKLSNLHGARREADYRLQRLRYERQRTAQAIVEQASRIIQNLTKHCHGEKRPALQAALTTWARAAGKLPAP